VKWSWQILVFVGIFLLMSLLVKPGGCTPSQPAGPPPGARFVTVSVAGRPAPAEKDLSAASFTLQAEVADTAEARGQGLIGRQGLQPGYGMLYVYPEPQQPKFDWSQMSFPVTDAFLAPDGTILALHQAAAHDATSYTPDKPVKLVLEVRSGWFEDRGIKAGDRLVLPPELGGPATPAATIGPAPAPKAAPQAAVK
jgi:uncharacterized membrane protein (UPF0127 family)